MIVCYQEHNYIFPHLIYLLLEFQNSTLTPTEPEQTPDEFNTPVNLEIKNDPQPLVINDNSSSSSKLNYDDILSPTNEKDGSYVSDFMGKSEKDRLSKLDQIVQNLYSTHKIGTLPAATMVHSGGKQLSIFSLSD